MSFEGAAISLGATVVSLAFASLVFAQWLGRRRPYQLAWSLGLGLYAIAAFTQFLAEAYGWSVTVYKVYYLVAARLVAVLGIGSVFLVHRRAGVGFALYTTVIFAGFAAAVAGATVNTDSLASVHDPRKRRPNWGCCVLGLAIPAVVQLVDRHWGADRRRGWLPRPVQPFMGVVCRRARRDCRDVRRFPSEPGLGESPETGSRADSLLTRTLKYLPARPTRR